MVGFYFKVEQNIRRFALSLVRFDVALCVFKWWAIHSRLLGAKKTRQVLAISGSCKTRISDWSLNLRKTWCARWWSYILFFLAIYLLSKTRCFSCIGYRSTACQSDDFRWQLWPSPCATGFQRCHSRVFSPFTDRHRAGSTGNGFEP